MNYNGKHYKEAVRFYLIMQWYYMCSAVCTWYTKASHIIPKMVAW